LDSYIKWEIIENNVFFVWKYATMKSASEIESLKFIIITNTSNFSALFSLKINA